MIQLNREKVYEGKLFNVVKVTLQNEDGQSVVRDVVEHPGAACIIPMLDNDTVLLIEQWRIGAKRPLWEIPAGTLDPGEDPLACAARELEEETGYKAGKLEHLFTMFPSPGIVDEKMHILSRPALRRGRPTSMTMRTSSLNPSAFGICACSSRPTTSKTARRSRPWVI